MFEKINKIINNSAEFVNSISEFVMYGFTTVLVGKFFGWAMHTIGVLATTIIVYYSMRLIKTLHKNYIRKNRKYYGE